MAKIDEVSSLMKNYQSVIVAFSGGVDSALLLFLTKMNIDRYIAITFLSYLYSDNERVLIDRFVDRFGINHKYIDVDPLADIKAIEGNPRERCYYCKHHLYSKLNEIKKRDGYDIIFDGSNADDKKVIRAGAKAINELAILSPLAKVGLTKDEIRSLAKNYNLPMHDKPSLSCYLTRFEYGVKIDRDMISRVAELESYLHSLGLISARCRVHSYTIVRIQLAETEMVEAVKTLRRYIVEKSMTLGYKYVTLDFAGDYSGSMDI